jgi:hypothetical protein
MPKRKKSYDSDEDDAYVPDAADTRDDDEDMEGVIEIDDDTNDADFAEEEPPKKKAKTSKSSSTTTKKASTSKKSTTTKTTAKKATTKKSTAKKSDDKKTTTTKKAAPKKKDNTIKSEKEAREVVHKFLKASNRPFSVQNLIDSLHGQVKKVMCQKNLDKLVADEKVSIKENKKAKIYYINQADMPVLSKEELQELDTQIKELTADRNELKSEVASLTSEKARYEKAMTNEQLTEAIEQLEDDIAKRQARLDNLTGEGAVLAEPGEKQRAFAKMNTYIKAWRERKSIFMGMVDRLCEEAVQEKPSVFIDDVLGLETDDTASVSWQDLGKIL